MCPDVTIILGEDSEPRPLHTLPTLRSSDLQSKVNDEEYLEGAPELLAEVAYSSRAIDLNQRRDDYKADDQLADLVLSIQDGRLFWFHFPSGEMITTNRQGVYRSTVFQGLWI